MALTLTTSGSLNTTVDNYAFSILSNTSSVQLGAVSLKLVVPGGCTIKNVNAGTSSVDSLVFLQQNGNLNIGMYTLSNWVVNTNDVILSITASGMSTGSFTLNTDEDWYCEIASSSAEPFTNFAIKMPSLASPYASVSTTLEAVSILSGVNPSITAVGAPNSSVFGSGSRTLGTASIAEGIRTLASGLASHAAGINTTASGQAAFSMGIETDADGMASFAAGSGSWAKGTATVAMGIGTIASASGQTVVGHYNLGLGDFNNLFVVGGGSGATTNLRKNLFRVYGGSGASTVGVEINTSETQYISSFDGFNVYGKTRFFGGVTGSSIDFNAVGVDTKTNLDPIGGTITTGSFTSNFYRWENLPTGGEMVLFGEVLKASVRLDHRGINFSLSEQTTNPGSTFLWTNSSNRLFYSSSAVILNDGNTLGSTMTIGTTDVNNLQLETNNTTRIFISSSGNVGIGTSSPTERLHVDGNLLVTGRITAEEFHTEFVSASIIYQSGSTQFGNSLDDTHIFTGSLRVNGSITGSLLGTSSWAINARTSSNIFPAITNNTSTYVLTATGDGTINGNSNLTFDGNDLILSNGNIKLPVNGYIFGGDTQILNGNHILLPANPPALPNDVLAGTSSLFARNTQIQIRSISEPDVVGGYESGSIFFKTPSGLGMTYTNEGRLGIGVSNPTNTLQIQGNVSASSYTGSLFGTSSWAVNAQTASFLPVGTYSITSSWATNALTASNITPSITNNTDNRVLTATGGGTINGESNLTFDGSVLTVTGRANISTSITSSTATVGVGSISALSAGQTTIRGSGADTVGALIIQTPSANTSFTVLNGGTTGVGENNPSARLHVKGSGATSATTALRVENSNTSASLVVTDDIRVGINKTTPNSELDVNGTVTVTGSVHVQLGSGFTGQMVANGNNFDLRNSSSGTHIRMLNSNNTTLSQVVTAENGLRVTPGANSTTSGLVITTGSYPAATLLSVGTNTLIVTGSNVGIGTLTPTNTLQVVGGITATSITASIISASSGITGSLFGTSSWAVNALTASFLSGAFLQNGNSFGTTAVLGTNDTQNLQFETSGSVRMTISSSGNVGIGTTTPSASLHVEGNFQISTGSLYTYGQNTDIDSGSFRTVMSISTGSYRAAFFDYVLTSGSNARAGTVFSVWQGTSVEYADTSTNDIGNTTGVNLLVSMSGANIGLFASSSNDNWSMKALARML